MPSFLSGCPHGKRNPAHEIKTGTFKRDYHGLSPVAQYNHKGPQQWKGGVLMNSLEGDESRGAEGALR